MSDKQTKKCAASGVHLFARYARTCCENGNEGSSNRSTKYIEELGRLVDRNDSADEKLLQQLLCRAFPGPVNECFGSDGDSKANPADFIWLINKVQTYWRYTHTGPKTDVIPSRPENGCRTIRAKVLRKYSNVDRLYVVGVEGADVFTIDLFDLKPSPGEFVYFHQRVICEIDEDRTEDGDLKYRGGEVIKPPGLQTDSSIAVPGMPFTSKSREFDLTGKSPEIKFDDGAGDVLIGVPATVLPPTKQAHCDCGHECKGGHPCPNAPHYAQFRDPSSEVVSPGRAPGKSDNYETSPVGVGGGYELITGIITSGDDCPPEYSDTGCPFNA